MEKLTQYNNISVTDDGKVYKTKKEWQQNRALPMG